MNHPIDPPARISPAKCFRAVKRATLTNVAVLYAMIGTTLPGAYSCEINEANDQVIIAWPEGNP